MADSSGVPPLDVLRSRLERHTPHVVEPVARSTPRAAVAVLFVGAQDPELLFIERSRRFGDRWSGQMAFPGGKREPQDSSLASTAARETREEVGIDLDGVEPFARLDDQHPSTAGARSLIISAFAWELTQRPDMTFSREVESAHWVALSRLLDPSFRIDYRYPLMPLSKFPGIVIGQPDRHVVWGLTYRIVESLLEVLHLSSTRPPGSW